MLPGKELIKTIEEFNQKFKEIANDCEVAVKAGPEHFEHYQMLEAWMALQNVVENKLLPFIKK